MEIIEQSLNIKKLSVIFSPEFYHYKEVEIRRCKDTVSRRNNPQQMLRNTCPIPKYDVRNTVYKNTPAATEVSTGVLEVITSERVRVIYLKVIYWRLSKATPSPSSSPLPHLT